MGLDCFGYMCLQLQILVNHIQGIMFRSVKIFWSYLRGSQRLAVWERRMSLSILCLLFACGQSVPAALALVSDSQNSWAVVCTGAGLQIIQTGDEGEHIPVGMQISCTCCIGTENNSFSPVAPNSISLSLRTAESVRYFDADIGSIKPMSRYGLSCRGPPSGTSCEYAFSDPPDSIFDVTDWYLRRFWL